MTGGPLLPEGTWRAVEILLLLCLAKAATSSLTIAPARRLATSPPSLVLGALFGGAFGRAVALLLHDPRLDPGAFALVGMGAFYGGLAHTPLSSLVLVCELAGSYDLLVPLMLAEGVVFVALRHRSLYSAQLPSRRESPAHRSELSLDALAGLKAAEVMTAGKPFVSFEPQVAAAEVVRRVSDLPSQDIFPVLGPEARIVGMITTEGLRILAGSRDLEAVAIAADIMQPPITAHEGDDARSATQVLLKSGLPQIPIVDSAGKIVGFLGETEVAQAYLRATTKS